MTEAALRPAAAVRAAGRQVVLYSSEPAWRGASTSFVNIARGLEDHGLPSTVVALEGDVAREFMYSGVDTALLRRGAGEVRRLRQVLRTLDANILIVDRAEDLRVAVWATFGLDIAVISRYSERRPPPPTDLLVRAAYRRSVREVVFPSQAVRDDALGRTPFMRRPPATTIPEGVDTSEFRPNVSAARRLVQQFQIDEPFFLAVGALSPEKHYEILLHALRVLGAAAPLLVICGDGPESGRLAQLARAHTLNVRFLGHIDSRSMVGAYSACTALIHAGPVERFGLTALEAMACGRPAVVVSSGALPDVVGPDGECAFHVPVDSTTAMADAIRRLIEDPNRGVAMGQRGRERVVADYSIAAMQRSYVGLIRRHQRPLRRV